MMSHPSENAAHQNMAVPAALVTRYANVRAGVVPKSVAAMPTTSKAPCRDEGTLSGQHRRTQTRCHKSNNEQGETQDPGNLQRPDHPGFGRLSRTRLLRVRFIKRARFFKRVRVVQVGVVGLRHCCSDSDG